MEEPIQLYLYTLIEYFLKNILNWSHFVLYIQLNC